MSIINSHSVALKRSAAEKIAADRQKYLDAGGVIYRYSSASTRLQARGQGGKLTLDKQNLRL